MNSSIDFSAFDPAAGRPPAGLPAVYGSQVSRPVVIAIIIIAGLLVLALLPGINDTTIPVLAGCGLVVVILLLHLVGLKQRSAMRAFAQANGWQYEDSQKVDRAGLPVADAFVGRQVTRRYCVSGVVERKSFQLYMVFGPVPGSWHHGYDFRTVLETEGWEPQVLEGNAVRRGDIEQMFRAAGLI